MDLDYGPQYDAFREEVRQFLQTHGHRAPDGQGRAARPSPEAVEWQKLLILHGYTARTIPKEYGGYGAEPDILKSRIIAEEFSRAGIPAGLANQGISMLVPTLLELGTEAQKQQWIEPTLNGEIIWCQGYSEPGAGSDLAALKTSARVENGDFVINGQKIWTTMAHDATHIFMLVRTDLDTPKKQQGISFVLAPMDQSGVEVRTITTLSGETEFCEVFFDNARTPRENLVGEMNKGWTMAKALLSFERIFIGSPSLAQNALGQLESFARGRGAFDDPVFRDRFAQAALDVEDHAALYTRFADQLKRGETLGADVSMLKIWVTECFQRITELMIEAAGPDGGTVGPLQVGNVGVDVLSSFYKARPATIYGGSNEIQRNILSKAVLGLPG